MIPNLIMLPQGVLKISIPQAAQVAVLVENSPFPDSPQHMESGTGLTGIGFAKINYSQASSTNCFGLVISHSFASVINYDTPSDVSIREVSATSSI